MRALNEPRSGIGDDVRIELIRRAVGPKRCAGAIQRHEGYAVPCDGADGCTLNRRSWSGTNAVHAAVERHAGASRNGKAVRTIAAAGCGIEVAGGVVHIGRRAR